MNFGYSLQGQVSRATYPGQSLGVSQSYHPSQTSSNSTGLPAGRSVQPSQNVQLTQGEFKDIFDQKYTGPGAWYSIHRSAIKAKTLEEKISFVKLVKNICTGFRCECNEHCLGYLESNPPEKVFHLENGVFIWSVEFHNVVNVRLKKPVMSEEVAFKLYSDSDIKVCIAASVNDNHSIDDGGDKSISEKMDSLVKDNNPFVKIKQIPSSSLKSRKYKQFL